MSAPKPLRAMSLRDSLGKTVRLLTKQGVDVRFRGHQPSVRTRGDKVVCLTLPELNDNAPPDLIEAIQGFLDHEVGHIFYTPFSQAARFSKGKRSRHSIANIIEDIRLEKLLPRDLPGTKENLEKMYDAVMDSFFGSVAIKAKDPKIDASESFSMVMVCAMRALAGQKAFQKFMDGNDLWPYFQPLMSKMPDLSKRLRSLDKFKDVERLTVDIIEAMAPPPKPKEEPDPEEPPEDEADSDDGEGHGDGEGTDDGDDEESGADDEDDGDKDDDSDTPSDDDLDGNPTEEDSNDYSGDKGKQSRTLKDALSMLEPAQRRALFLYKRRKQTVAQISKEMSATEDQTIETLAKARKRLRELLNGG